jgi:PKD repeat protein
LNDTSNIEAPSFTYPDTGIYKIKLVVNPGDPCSDSATMQIGLYPGFFPDFVSSGICVTKPTSFTDATTHSLWISERMAMEFWENWQLALIPHVCEILFIVTQLLA